MSQKYAKGSRAWGICGRSGKKALLSELVFDGRYPNMRVLPEYFEGRHPQEYLPKIDDPVALYRPSPEVILPPTAPILQVLSGGGTANLVWTPSETDITEIASYTIFRNESGGEFSTLIVCRVRRDFLGGIIGVEHCATIPTVPDDDTGTVIDKPGPEDAPVMYVDSAVTTGLAYCYYVTAQPMGNNLYTGSGPPSATSNVACVTISSFLRLLEDGSRRLLETDGARRLLETAP